MRKAAFVFLLIGSVTVKAQNPNLDYKAAVKIYNISTLEIIRHAVYFGTNNTRSYNLQLMHPALALQWQSRRRNFHEVELTRLMINKSYNTYDVGLPGGGLERSGSRNLTNISLRYEHILSFAKNKDRRFVPSLGFGLASTLYRFSFDPKSSTQFKLATTNVAFEGQVTPRLNYHLKSRFYLDLNVPVSVARFGATTSTNRNPQIPVRQQKISNFDFSLLPSFYSVRLGLGFKI